MKRTFRLPPPHLAATLVAGSLALLSTASATTTVLDSFDSVIFGVNTLGPTSVGPSSMAADSDIPGIQRQVDIAIASGTGSASSGNLLGVLIYDNGALMKSALTFEYTLPAYDLAASGATDFGYILKNTELGKDTDYTFSIESADGFATGSGTLPIVAGLINIPLGSLVVSGTPYDDVTKITFVLLPQVEGTDLVIDSYGFDLPPPNQIPEPGTFAAVGFVCALGAWTAYRRRSVKA